MAKATETANSGGVLNIPRGRPKSGRVWKTPRTGRYSEIMKVKPLRSSWKRKEEERKEKKAMKLYEKELQDARQETLEKKRKRAEEKKKRKLENEKKSEVVQTIKDTRKIKKMKRKQLRMIQKR
ncbi:coiled-coil domain-containing protein 86-like [Lineus longissimus]|uniref:coiled-coil domain-containing protein 86-like n=1 Tax=Lineus longissimus TaxID=88925 RepID=UPI002B4D12D0